MKFEELLIAAIRRSEIPLRFEPGAEEAVAKPVIEVLRAWVLAHDTGDSAEHFAARLVAELDGTADLPE